MKTRWTKQRMLAGTLGLLIAAPFAAEVASGQADFYYTDAGSNKRVTTTDNWSTSPTEIIQPAAEPGALDNLFFNMDGVNSSNPHLAAGNRAFNSVNFRSSGTVQFDAAGFTSENDRFLLVGSGGFNVLSGAGPVTVGTSGNNAQRILTRFTSLNSSLVNESDSLLTFNRNVIGFHDENETGTLTISGSGSGGILFNANVNDRNADTNLSVIINRTGANAGDVTFAGNARYTGSTTIQSGGLIVNADLESSGVTVQDGGRIGGEGTVFNDLHFEEGAQFDFSTSLTLNVNGTVTFDGFGIANVVADWASLDLNTPYTLIDGDINVANLANLGSGAAAEVGNGRSAYFEEDSLNMTVIPEPNTLGLIGLALGMGALARRRLIA